MEKANDYHRYRLTLTPRGQLVFEPRPSTPALSIRTLDPGITWRDASVTAGSELYNQVTVTGTTGSGQPISATRTTSDVGITNTLDRRGRTRSITLVVQAATDATALQVLADAYLLRYGRTPLKGTLTIVGDAAGFPASMLGGLFAGTLIRLANLIDPDTGGQGRDAIIVAVTSYDEKTDTATLAVDNTRDDLDAVLARMAAVR
jgi:hypothetical protein